MSIIKMLGEISPEFARQIVKKLLKKYKYIKLPKSDPITQEQISLGLRNLGITEGRVLFVHSSLTSFGYVAEGANAIINALLDTIGIQGTLVMPSFFLKYSVPELYRRGIVFDPISTPSTVGAISEAFRKRPGVIRAIHPTNSVCAYGPEGEYITSDYENASTQFGVGTPLYKCKEKDALIVGLGSDLGHVTFYHVIEDVVADFPVDIYLKKLYALKVIRRDRSEKIVTIKAFNPKTDLIRIDHERGKWIRSYFTDFLTRKGMLRFGNIGQALCWAMPAKNLFQAQMELLQQGITIYTRKKDYRKLQLRTKIHFPGRIT